MQNRKPMVLVLAGPNGSGKSTITTYFDIVGNYTNADDVVSSTKMNNLEAAKMVAHKKTKKAAFLWDLLDLSYTMECEPEDWESIELERIISREKDPVLKEAL